MRGGTRPDVEHVSIGDPNVRFFTESHVAGFAVVRQVTTPGRPGFFVNRTLSVHPDADRARVAFEAIVDQDTR